MLSTFFDGGNMSKDIYKHKHSIYRDKYIKYKTKYLKLKGGTQVDKYPDLRVFKQTERIEFFENSVYDDLHKILNMYDLSPYIFTNKVIVQAYGIPHSHPVLTITSIYTDQKGDPLDNLLANFIHEQLHWYFEQNKEKENELIKELMDKYKGMKTELPEGANGKYSTYLHIGVCTLEYKGLINLRGDKIAKNIMKQIPYYTGVYKLVVDKYDELLDLLNKYDLVPF